MIDNVAHQAYVPVVVGRDRLVDANSKMALVGTAAEMAGPSLAGGLVQILMAPIAVAADAISFLVSALLTSRIRTREPTPGPSHRTRRMWPEIVEGLRLALNEPRLRALIGSRALLNFFNAMLEAVFLLYVVERLGLGGS